MAFKRNKKASAERIKSPYLALTKFWNPFFGQVIQFTKNNHPVKKTHVKFPLKQEPPQEVKEF